DIMKYKLLPVFLILSFTCIIFAGWQRTYGGIYDDKGFTFAQTPDGGYIITGRTESFGAGLEDVYLIKTDPSGNVIWTKTYGGSSQDWGYSVKMTADGGYIIAGYTYSFGDSCDVYLVKTDASGDTMWTRYYGGPYWEDAYSVEQTSDGGYIVVGYTESFGEGSRNIYLIKTDSSGDTMWTKTYGGTNYSVGRSVLQTPDGGYAIVGYTNSFGTGDYDVYLIKTDPSGNTEWTKTYGGAALDKGFWLQQTSDGGYIIAGGSYSFSATGSDAYIIKTDAFGDTMWTKTYSVSDYDWTYSIYQTTDGGYIATGYIQDAGADELYLLKINSDGDTMWTKTYGGTAADVGRCVIQTTDQGYAIVGYTQSFGAGGYDVYFIKTDSLGNIVEPNYPPQFADCPTDTIFITAGEDTSLSISAFDPDSDDISCSLIEHPEPYRDFWYDSVDCAGYECEILLDIYPAESDTGTYNFTFQVCDTLNCTECGFVVVVLPAPNIPPEFVNCPESIHTVFTGGNTVLEINAVDLDSNIISCSLITHPEPYGAFWSDSLVCETSSFQGFLNIEPAESDTGIYEFAFQVCDAETCIQCGFEILIIDTINHPPEIISEPSESSVYADSVWEYLVIAEDPDGDSLIYNIENGCGAEITIDDTGYISWIPSADDTGFCDITIIVCDEVGACDTQEFSIEILPNNMPPEAPIDILAEACGPEITVSWTPPPDEDIEGFIIYRGLEPELLEIIDSVAGDIFSAIDTPYTLDTTYYYAVSAFDSAGYESPLSVIDTAYPYPYRVDGFSYELLGGDQVELSWTPTLIDSEYILFYAEGDTLPSFEDTLAIIYPPESSWISPPGLLTPGKTYTFSIAALATCGYFDNSGNVYFTITIADTGYEDACRRVYIKIPKPGWGLCGNSAMVKAQTDCPEDSLLNISAVLFQKKYLPDGEWTDITNLNPSYPNHPNPDTTHPYFIHWWVDAELEGEYLIRAVAFDTLGNPDTLPDAIPIHIGEPCGNSGDYEPDSAKGVPENYIYTYWERIYPHAGTQIYIGDFDNTEDWLEFPPGIVETPDILYFTMTNRDEETIPYYSVGEFMELQLRSGITSTVSGDSIAFYIQYPDFNNDGIIDSTLISEDDIWLFRFNGTDWDSIDCILDWENNTISARVNSFGKYSILSTTEPMWIMANSHPDKISMSIFPSPFNTAMGMLYTIPSSDNVTIEIFDIMGHRVAMPVNEPQTMGTHTITWTPPDDAPSGIYLVKFTVGDNSITTRTVLVR
ncbi:hypothetical protein DRQ33_03540, partial [bacterium]